MFDGRSPHLEQNNLNQNLRDGEIPIKWLYIIVYIYISLSLTMIYYDHMIINQLASEEWTQGAFNTTPESRSCFAPPPLLHWP